MAISVVQQYSAPTAFNGAAAVVNFTSAPSVGSWLIFAFHSTATVAVGTPPTGVTQVAAADDAGRPTVLYYKKVAFGDPSSYSFTSTNTTTATNEAHGIEVSGLDLTDPLDKTSVGTAGTYTSMQPGSTGTLSTANELAVVVCGLGGTSGGGEAVSGGFTVNGSTDHPRTIFATQIVSATTALNPTISWTTSRRANSLIATFKEGAAPSAAVVWHVYNGSTWDELTPILL